jgi:hypothetical protein
MSNVGRMRELTKEEMNMIAGGVLPMNDGIQEGVGDIVAGAKAAVAGQVKTGLGLIAEGINDIKGRS